MYLVFTITQNVILSCKYCFQNGFERKDIKENDLNKVFEMLRQYLITNKIKFVDCTIFVENLY